MVWPIASQVLIYRARRISITTSEQYNTEKLYIKQVPKNFEALKSSEEHIGAEFLKLDLNVVRWRIMYKKGMFLSLFQIAALASLAPFVKMFFDQFGYWAPLITVIYHVR